MKIIHLFLFVLLFFTISGATYSQNLKENEMVVIQGETFILHQVRTGETVYSISRDFKVKSSELQKYNPKISAGLSIGDILKIPYNENADLSDFPKIKKGDPTSFINYTIESKGETAYSISQKYGITVEEFYAYNPTIKKLKRRMTVKIPQWEFKSKPEESQTTTNTQKELIEHTVLPGETLYSIGKKYQLSESEILFYNPTAKTLKAGSKLVLPKKAAKIANVEETISDKYTMHTIVSGETLYGISKKYKLSEKELITINPDLKTAFRTGTVIKIPVKEVGVPEAVASTENILNEKDITPKVIFNDNIPQGCQPSANIFKNDTITVVLFLPLFTDANELLNKDFINEENDSLNQIVAIDTLAIIDTVMEMVADTVIERETPVQLFKQFSGNSEKFLQFYEGVLIAIDSMQKAGMKLKLNVYDTKDNPESIRKTVNNVKFLETDLIIGPVYENVQKEVSRISSTNRIPMISPFTPKSTVISSNPNFYQINPTREYITQATANMVAADYSNSNFIVVRTSPYEGTPEGQLVEMIRSKIAQPDTAKGRFTVYDFKTGRAAGLLKVLVKHKENVVFIPTADEGELSVAISNLNNQVGEFPITLIGSGNYQQKYPSIEIAHFHNLKLQYINPYWVNYDDSLTVNYIEKFISNFGTEPNNYGVQGFDVSWYFLNALYYYGKDFQYCLPYIKTNLLQGDYYFERDSQWGGFMNQGVSVISYKKNFEVVRRRIIGKPQFE